MSSLLQGRRVLIVEDDFLVTQLLKEVIEDEGGAVVGPYGWVTDALDLIARQPDAFDCAVVDVNLHGTKSYAVADALDALGVSFILSTGYGTAMLDSAYSHYPHCEKPFEIEVLIETLAQLRPK